jgi:hypothetical protein
VPPFESESTQIRTEGAQGVLDYIAWTDEVARLAWRRDECGFLPGGAKVGRSRGRGRGRGVASEVFPDSGVRASRAAWSIGGAQLTAELKMVADG